MDLLGNNHRRRGVPSHNLRFHGDGGLHTRRHIHQRLQVSGLHEGNHRNRHEELEEEQQLLHGPPQQAGDKEGHVHAAGLARGKCQRLTFVTVFSDHGRQRVDLRTSDFLIVAKIEYLFWNWFLENKSQAGVCTGR